MGIRSVVLGFASVPATAQKNMRKGLEGGGNACALQAYEGLLLVAFKRMSMLLLSVTIMTALAVATAEAEQVPDDSYNPPIQNPAYPENGGPVVAIDEAHYNFHTMTESETAPARYRPFATLLQRDGYVVRPSTSQFSAQSLEGVDILVIANARAKSTADQEPDYTLPTPSAFTDAEIEAVRTWVEGGGSLWLIADHLPWPGAAEKLGAAFGVRMLNGYAKNEKVDDGNFYFRRTNSPELLTNHPITNGRTDLTATERVSKQVSFTGSAFQVDENRNAQPLLIFGPDVVSIMPTRAWTWNSSTPRIPVGGWYQGAVMRAGEGRVAVFGEAAMFSAQLKDGHKMGMNASYAEENYKFVLNVTHWLSGLLPDTQADTTPPESIINSGPSGTVNNTSATFAFSSSEASSTFECKLDGSAFETCSSPKSYSNLSEGSHTFEVRAKDPAGNTDASPASRTWTVNTAAATTTSLTSTADTKLVENAPTTNYGGATPARATGDEPAGSAKDVYSLLRWDLSSIPAGSEVSAVSIDLNVTNASNQSYQLYELKRPWVERGATWLLYASGSSWEVAGAKGTLDRGAQVGTITPRSTGKQSSAISASVVQRWLDDPSTNQGIIVANTTNTDAFDFSSREAATSSLSPQLRVTYTTSGTTDTTPPESTIDSGPSGTVSSASAAFTFSSNEANSVFECRLDGVAFSACNSPKSYSNLSEGSHIFEVRATDAAGNTDPTPAVHTWIVDTSAQSDPVLVGAGDIASCASSGDEATAKLLDGISGTVFAAGDTVYEDGTSEELANCYEPSWGRHKARTYPIPGNHEYHTANATGYFGYFGAAAGDPGRGYYSYDLGQWHIVALNSVCAQVGGCEATSPMVTWLKQDLAANPRACTLAYVHHPLFSSGPHGNQTYMRPTWDALYAADADVVISGNDHDYERFAPQNPSGIADPARGIREFVVGTGGKSLYSFTTIQPNSEVRYSGGFGVLKLTLHPSGYDWQFVSEAGKSFADSGSGQCHAGLGNTDTVAPTVSSVVPNDGSTDVAVTASAEATFSEAMDPNTISTTTFTLTKQDTREPLAAQVSYDAATMEAILHPHADLEAGTTYTATLKGGAMGVKDLAGNPLGADKTWSFSTSAVPLPLPDITAPETTIDSGPSGTVSTSSPSFVFSSSEPNSTFECSLDGGAFASCSSPKSYSGLSEGSHTFDVRATDATGNTDATPASRTWTVAIVRTASVTSTADTYILENASKRNYGTANPLGVDGDEPVGAGKDKSALLKWDLSTLPAGSKISSASVTLNVTNNSTETYQAYALKRPWVQSAATWLLYAAGKSWQVAGAKGSLDRGTTVVGNVSPSTTGRQTFALPPAVVQSWVDNPASNNGIIIANATNTDGFDFSSRESTTSDLRPQLNVTYTAP